MGDVAERLPLPRLVLRVGALGNRRFGRDNGIDEPPEALAQAARVTCAEVMHEIAAAVVEIFGADLGAVLPPMDRPRRFWWETRLGLFFGRADVWGRRASAGKPAPVFRDESPLVSVLAGREPGGDTFVTQAALAMNPAAAPPAGSADRYVEFESVAVVVEDPDAPSSSRPVEDPRTFSVGKIPAQSREPDASGVRSRLDARARADVGRRRAFGFRAQSEALRHHSDLLVAVWDADAEGKAGGTSESVTAALEERLPVVAVRVTGPGAATVHVLQSPGDLRHPPRTPWQGDLKDCVKRILGFPDAPPAHASEHEGHYSSYHPRAVFRAFVEGAPVVAPWPARRWPPLKGWMDRKRTFLSAAAAVLGLAAAPKRAGAAPPAAAAQAAHAPARAAGPYDAPRRRASDYSEAFGNAHRGGMVTAYALGLLAVLLALLGLPIPHETGWALIAGFVGVLEFASLLVLFALWRTSTLEDWHEAYTDTRILAEALRCMEHLTTLGVHVPLPRLSAGPAGAVGLDAGQPVANDPRHLWSLWYFRALLREAPLKLPVIPRATLEEQRDRLVAEWIGEQDGGAPHPASQAAYHQRVVAAYRRLVHGIERWTSLGFMIILGAVLFHLVFVAFHGPGWLGAPFVAVCLGGPAYLAALSGFLSQIEAVRIQQRSAGMNLVLAERARSLAALDLSHPESAESRWRLAVEAAATAEIMVEETAGWALIYKNADIRAG